MRVEGKAKQPLPENIEDTMKESGGWAKWAPGLVRAKVGCGRFPKAYPESPRAISQGLQKMPRDYGVLGSTSSKSP